MLDFLKLQYKKVLNFGFSSPLKLDVMAKSIGIHVFGFEDIFRCYRDNEHLKQPFGRMDALNVLT